MKTLLVAALVLAGGRDGDTFHKPTGAAGPRPWALSCPGTRAGPVFEDIDVSGATHPYDRPGMAGILRGIQAGEYGGVAAYSLDRLSREPAHGDLIVREVTTAGGVILTPDIPDALDSPTGEFTFGMLLQVARLYRATAKARFATSKERAIAAGIPVTNRTAVGYRRNAQRRYEPDPAVAPTIRQAFEMRARGEGPRQGPHVADCRLLTVIGG